MISFSLGYWWYLVLMYILDCRKFKRSGSPLTTLRRTVSLCRPFDVVETTLHFMQQVIHDQAVMDRYVGGDFRDRFRELAVGSFPVSRLKVVAPHSDLNQTLQEPPVFFTVFMPEVFKYIMRFEKKASIELKNPPVKSLVHQG